MENGKVVQSSESNRKGKVSKWRKELLKKKDRERKRREKGGRHAPVEKCNRFVRRWYPKGTDFGKCTRAGMHRLERIINSIHRRLLGGKTAYTFDTAFAKAA